MAQLAKVLHSLTSFEIIRSGQAFSFQLWVARNSGDISQDLDILDRELQESAAGFRSVVDFSAQVVQEVQWIWAKFFFSRSLYVVVEGDYLSGGGSMW